MRRIENNPDIAVAGECFTAKGKGENLGYFGKEENKAVSEKMKIVFSEWINNGHNNFDDENTVILKINLKNGVLFSNGARYDIEF